MHNVLSIRGFFLVLGLNLESKTSWTDEGQKKELL